MDVDQSVAQLKVTTYTYHRKIQLWVRGIFFKLKDSGEIWNC